MTNEQFNALIARDPLDVVHVTDTLIARGDPKLEWAHTPSAIIAAVEATPEVQAAEARRQQVVEDVAAGRLPEYVRGSLTIALARQDAERVRQALYRAVWGVARRRAMIALCGYDRQEAAEALGVGHGA